jgi:hypothetical protein
MRPLLRLIACAGWFANASNQMQLWDYDRSKSVRPVFVLLYVFGDLSSST